MLLNLETARYWVQQCNSVKLAFNTANLVEEFGRLRNPIKQFPSRLCLTPFTLIILVSAIEIDCYVATLNVNEIAKPIYSINKKKIYCN